MNRLLIALAATSALGCFDVDRITGGPPLGYENNPETCSDGFDNDNDGLIDCLDPDCIGQNLCGEIIPLLPPGGFEGDAETCTDGIDNDLNGQFDCGDRKCQTLRELCCVTEFDNASCSNRVDDDGNGFADCQDFSCRSNPFVTVCRSEARCVDGRVGLTVDDCCSDGHDNDNDGLVDCDDPDCASLEVCTGPIPIEPENTLELCTDGIDNDRNGFTDCADFSCTRADRGATPEAIAHCASIAENTLERCMDGIDNDGNGFTDCADFSCSRSPDPAIVEYCNSILENTTERCTDGIDNDGNGFTDCDDRQCCTGAGVCIDAEVQAHCDAIKEWTFERCTDGIDNDGNGFADCNDFSCRTVREDVVFSRATRRPDPSCANTPDCEGDECECFVLRTSPCNESVVFPADVERVDGSMFNFEMQRAIAACTDGLDGDVDGFIDCDDWDCQWNPLLNPRARGRTEPGLCQGGRYDPSILAWRAPNEGERPTLGDRSPTALLCR
ncbi:MAG: hypothetical protein KF901_27685 [Myxococcales bacterium]|nr:hypothetical protein [Myxococcales bacterium]